MSMPNVPGRRKAIPRPFERKRITINAPEVKRDWQHLPAGEFEPGDIITSHGRVLENRKRENRVQLVCGEPESHILNALPDEVFYGFARVRE